MKRRDRVRDKPLRVRIAPSPTGPPHIGTAYIALFNYVFAKAGGGKFFLRIEDTDRARSTRESEEAILRGLRWLGLEWDEGPDVGGPFGPYRQSERGELYREHASMLLAAGKAYRCFCAPERLEQMRQVQRLHKLPPGYDRRCMSIPPEEAEGRARDGEPCVVRMAVPRQRRLAFTDMIRGEVEFDCSTVDDQVLLKSDGFPTYHLASVVDDHFMETSHVIRAEEWISSVPKHALLYEYFGWEPPRWAHMPILRNPDRSKIKKREAPISLEEFRGEGFLPEAVVNFLALMGWSRKEGPEVFGIEEMTGGFALSQISTSAPVFNMEKLEWLNGVYIRNLSDEELARRLEPFLPDGARSRQGEIRGVVPLIKERLKKLSDFPEWAGFFFAEELAYDPAILVPKKRSDAAPALRAAREALGGLGEEWRAAEIEAALRSAAGRVGWQDAELFMSVRAAVTGKTATPPLFESMARLGRAKCLARIERAAEMVPQ